MTFVVVHVGSVEVHVTFAVVESVDDDAQSVEFVGDCDCRGRSCDCRGGLVSVENERRRADSVKSVGIAKSVRSASCGRSVWASCARGCSGTSFVDCVV